MKRILSTAVMVVLLGSGCTLKTHSAPIAAPEFAKADYTVLGKTNHEECGTYIFLDWAHLFSNQKASTSSGDGINGLISGLVSGGSREESRALYHALDKMPEATHLLAHRAHTTSSGVLLFGGRPLFGERCASVEARGVKIGEKPAAGSPTL